jgi:hypothetical protein
MKILMLLKGEGWLEDEKYNGKMISQIVREWKD